MTLTFTKMHGLGNDFVVIDAIKQEINLTPEKVRLLADRHRGIGFDQLLLVEKSSSPAVDFNYRIYNADGGEVGQCGNGARCLARFILDQGLSDKKELVVATHTRQMQLKLLSNGLVSVSLGVPEYKQSPNYTEVNVGNPHAVITVDDVSQAEVGDIGAQLNQHTDFAEGVNVGFMEIVGPDRIKLRVYERGVGETEACGSGACAAVVSGRAVGLLADRVVVELLGGELEVEWSGDGQEVWLIGPAETVYTGVYE